MYLPSLYMRGRPAMPLPYAYKLPSGVEPGGLSAALAKATLRAAAAQAQRLGSIAKKRKRKKRV
jgi:hypothetical protein